jgi:hypothetical protein
MSNFRRHKHHHRLFFMRLNTLLAFVFGVSAASAASSQDFTRTPLPSNHPLLGTWRIELPQMKCFEEYELRSDGTKLSMSGEERNESEFAISVTPGSTGFYKWTDRITKNNGKPDCSGSNTQLGHVAVNYVRVHPSGQRFLLCEAEDMKSCYAEFQRKTK